MQENEETKKPLSERAACVFLVMIITSAIGWLAENIGKIYFSHCVDDRFHLLPFIFPYGLAYLAMHVALGDTDDIGFFGKKLFKNKSLKTKILSNVLYILIICFFVFFGELAVGNMYEAITGAALWNYSGRFLHVTRYVCLMSTLGFGVGAYFLMKFVLTPLYNLLLRKGNKTAILIVDCTLGALVVADSISMILITCITKTPPHWWKIPVNWFK
ncbi:MAG: putative ABC transporter permease [Clostridia bacterium]|nr:putative ABC transporter permease [Clostridia bacterium]